MTVNAALGWLGRNAAALLAGGVFAGLIAPPLAALLRPLMVPVIVLILAVTLVRLDWGAMAGYGRRPGLVALGVIWLMVASPTVVWAVVYTRSAKISGTRASIVFIILNSRCSSFIKRSSTTKA